MIEQALKNSGINLESAKIKKLETFIEKLSWCRQESCAII